MERRARDYGAAPCVGEGPCDLAGQSASDTCAGRGRADCEGDVVITQDWQLVDNPDYAGAPRLLTPACHDGSPMVDLRCACGDTMHVHETQIAGVEPFWEIRSVCKGCSETLVLPPGVLHGAFAQMRRQGWIA